MKNYVLTEMRENTESYAESRVLMVSESLTAARAKMHQLYSEKLAHYIENDDIIGTDNDIGAPYFSEMEAFIAVGVYAAHERYTLAITEVEDEWFGLVRWHDDDVWTAIDAKCKNLSDNQTVFNIVRDRLRHHSFTDCQIATGWDFIYNVVDEVLKENHLDK